MAEVVLTAEVGRPLGSRAVRRLRREGKVPGVIYGHGTDPLPIAVEARKVLAERGIAARVVSVPCFELFLAAPAERRQAVIGEAPVRVAVEAAVRQGWDEIIGSDGMFVGMTGFGASGPYKELYAHFGITAAAVAKAASTKLGVK